MAVSLNSRLDSHKEEEKINYQGFEDVYLDGVFRGVGRLVFFDGFCILLGGMFYCIQIWLP